MLPTNATAMDLIFPRIAWRHHRWVVDAVLMKAYHRKHWKAMWQDRNLDKHDAHGRWDKPESQHSALPTTVGSPGAHTKTMRGRNTILLLDTWNLCVDFIIGKPRLQATAIRVTFDQTRRTMIGLVVSTVTLRSTPEVGEATMTTQAMMSIQTCTASPTQGTTSAGTFDKSIYLSKVHLVA